MNQRDRQRGGQERSNTPTVADSIAQQIRAIPNNVGLHEGLSAENLVKYADQLGLFLKQEGLKTTQIRKFLDAINRISLEGRSLLESDDKRRDYFRERSIFLKPQLAYASGRTRKREVEHLMKVLEPCIDRVKEANDFERLKRFVEAIVAYHRFYGGED